MDVQAAFASVEQHFEAFAASVKEKLEQDLPVLGEFVQKASTNPVTVAIASAVHLPEAPEVMQALADDIAKIDAALGAAKAAGAAQAQADAAAAANPPAEPEPAQ